MDWKKALSIPYRIVAKRAVGSSSILNPKWEPFENRQLAAASLSICARGKS